MSSRSSSRAAAAHQFPAMARLRAAVAAPRSNAGAGGGALVPPGVVQVGDRVAEPGADGAGVAADDLRGWSSRGRRARGRCGPSRGPSRAGPAAAAGCRRRPRGRAGRSCWSRRAPRRWCRGWAGGGRGPGPRRWPGPGPRRRRCRGRCRRPAAGGGRERGPGRAGGRVRRASLARDGTGRGVDAHLSSPPRPGGRAVRGGPGRCGGRSPGSG